jgi:hypothetical protein
MPSHINGTVMRLQVASMYPSKNGRAQDVSIPEKSTSPLECHAASVRLWNGLASQPGTCRNQGGAAAQPRCAHQSPLKHPFRASPSSARPLAAGLASHAVSAHVHPRFEHACFARATARVMSARPGRLRIGAAQRNAFCCTTCIGQADDAIGGSCEP